MYTHECKLWFVCSCLLPACFSAFFSLTRLFSILYLFLENRFLFSTNYVNMSNFPKNQILQELRMFELLRCDTHSERAARAGCRFWFGFVFDFHLTFYLCILPTWLEWIGLNEWRVWIFLRFLFFFFSQTNWYCRNVL